jgi:hypothetical protein
MDLNGWKDILVPGTAWVQQALLEVRYLKRKACRTVLDNLAVEAGLKLLCRTLLGRRLAGPPRKGEDTISESA